MPEQTSNISRWVAFLFTPLIALIAGFVALKAKQWFNVDVSSEAVAVYVGGIILSVVGLGVTWLRNRGKYEIAKEFGFENPEVVDRIMQTVEERLPQVPQVPPRSAGGVQGSPTGGPPA